jgi:hypothetical protein
VSPTPLIELQRRLTLVGAIRAGGEKPERGVGKKLEAWRVTSPRRQLVEQAAQLYGGQVTRWTSPVGEEWQTYTTAAELPVLVMPSYSLRQSYELWEGATKRTRLCDGVEEELTSQPCICNATGEDKCDLYTRLVVCLPELDTALGWRLITRGANAAHELPTMMKLIETVSSGQTFVRMRLHLDQRRGVVDGQVTRFVVPTLDLGVGYLALAAPTADGSARELPSAGSIPAERREPTVEQALAAVDAPSATITPARTTSAAAGPELAEPEPLPQQTKPTAWQESRQTKALTEPQAKKLNTLVGKLRPGQITTEQLWAGVAKMRSLDPEVMIEAGHGRDHEGMLHWAPLRESLSRPEATQLADWLEQVEGRTEPPEAPSEPPVAAAADPGREQGDPGPPYIDRFPPGY